MGHSGANEPTKEGRREMNREEKRVTLAVMDEQAKSIKGTIAHCFDRRTEGSGIYRTHCKGAIKRLRKLHLQIIDFARLPDAVLFADALQFVIAEAPKRGYRISIRKEESSHGKAA